eukprot:3405223-Rhodomonas_salina.2
MRVSFSRGAGSSSRSSVRRSPLPSGSSFAGLNALDGSVRSATSLALKAPTTRGSSNAAVRGLPSASSLTKARCISSKDILLRTRYRGLF